MALFGLALDVFDLAPEPGALARLGLTRHQPLPARLMWGGWVVESAGLTALYLLVQGRSGAWWLDGLVTAGIGWVFRGPLMVLSVVSWSRLPRDPWWPLALRWLVLYVVCGLALALLGRAVQRERS